MEVKSRLWQAGLLAAMTVLVAGCGGQPAEAPLPSSSGTPTAAPTAPVAPTPTPVRYTYPLTGMASETESVDRPIMVMIENSPAARPQTGLDAADLVYEILAEGEITRFAAFYQSRNAEAIGPVRSIRPYYVKIGEGWDAVLVHAGWSQEAINRIKNNGLNHFDQVYGDDRYYWRDSSRKAPHNLYTSVAKIREGMTNKKYRQEWKIPTLPAFTKPNAAPNAAGTPAAGAAAGTASASPSAATSASPAAGASSAAPAASAAPAPSAAARLDINYLRGYKVSYEYDAQTGLYGRFMNDKEHRDAKTDVQLTAANVLIVETKHVVLDNEGRRDVNVDGPGDGLWLTQGQAREVRWARQGGVIRVSVDGREVELTPGVTWVQVVPTGSDYAVQ